MGFKTVPVSYTVCGQKGEVYSYDPLCLSAPSGTTFTSVQFASYGTPNGGCGGFSTGGCNAGSSGGVVSGAFLGRTSGCVSPDNGTFGDPCVGTYKRLYIQLQATGTIQVFVPVPTINSFYASPNPQTSGTGAPSYSTTLNWGSTNGQYATLTSSAGESWNVAVTGNQSITNLPQSSDSNSPATRSYTLTVYNELNEPASSTITVEAYNDNTPSNTWTTTFSNLSPSTTVDLQLGTLAGVDMPCTISVAGAGNFVGFGGSFSGSRNFNNGEAVVLRTTTLPYNTDVTGETGIYGKSNPKTVTVTTPSGSFNVSVITAAPRISEIFDYADNKDKYPFEDIDFIPNTPTEFITSVQVDADDIQIPMEVKVDQPDAQISINNGSWQDVREI